MTRIRRGGNPTNNPYSVVAAAGYGGSDRANAVTLIIIIMFALGCIIVGNLNNKQLLSNNGLSTKFIRGSNGKERISNPMNGVKMLPDVVVGGDKRLKLAEDIFKTADEEEEDTDTSIGNPDVQRLYVFDDHMMFHHYNPAKSGEVVEEMLMFHAYVYAQNATYGGCCGDPSLKMTAHETLLAALGLDGVLQFKCPEQYENEEGSSVRRSVIPRQKFHSDDTRVWTPEYVDYLRSLIKYPKRGTSDFTITVHMQRGDSSPCNAKHNGYYRYLPNSHYQSLIDKYYQPNARVIIYTTSAKSFESLEEFRKRGYEVHADASMANSWKDFATSDVMIMSRSDYLMVPAMVAKGLVVYTPFWHHSLRRWKRVPKSIMQQTDEETEHLRTEHCQISSNK